MPEYAVRWAIEVDAQTPHEAAAKALEAITREGSIAHVFTVTEVTATETYLIDLDPLPPCDCGYKCVGLCENYRRPRGLSEW